MRGYLVLTLTVLLFSSCCYKELQLPPSFSLTLKGEQPQTTDSIAIIRYGTDNELAYYDSLSKHFGYLTEPLKALQTIELNRREKIMIRTNYSTEKFYVQPVYLPSQKKGCSGPDMYLFGYYLNGQLYKDNKLVLKLK